MPVGHGGIAREHVHAGAREGQGLEIVRFQVLVKECGVVVSGLGELRIRVGIIAVKLHAAVIHDTIS